MPKYVLRWFVKARHPKVVAYPPGMDLFAGEPQHSKELLSLCIWQGSP